MEESKDCRSAHQIAMHRARVGLPGHRESAAALRLQDDLGAVVEQAVVLALIWSDPVNRCESVGLSLFLFLSLFLSFSEDRASSSRGRFGRRLISLIFAGRNRIILIRRELPLTSVASPAEPVA